MVLVRPVAFNTAEGAARFLRSFLKLKKSRVFQQPFCSRLKKNRHKIKANPIPAQYSIYEYSIHHLLPS